MFERFLERLSFSSYQNKFVIFDEMVCIRLFGYNIETVMAEKMETILSRGTLSTRPRDYYDIYILATTQKYDKALFRKALGATSEHRGSKEYIGSYEAIMEVIKMIMDK